MLPDGVLLTVMLIDFDPAAPSDAPLSHTAMKLLVGLRNVPSVDPVNVRIDVKAMNAISHELSATVVSENVVGEAEYAAS